MNNFGTAVSNLFNKMTGNENTSSSDMVNEESTTSTSGTRHIRNITPDNWPENQLLSNEDQQKFKFINQKIEQRHSQLKPIYTKDNIKIPPKRELFKMYK
jgi:hypothetical protein